MKKILLFILCLIMAAVAQPREKPKFGDFLVKTALVIEATDFTNTTKSDYKVFFEVSNENTINEALGNQGIDMCTLERFKKRVGSGVCNKPIKYMITDNSDDADIIISDKGGFVGEKKLAVCLDSFGSCDVVVTKGKITINRDEMAKKGFMPDPSLKMRK